MNLTQKLPMPSKGMGSFLVKFFKKIPRPLDREFLSSIVSLPPILAAFSLEFWQDGVKRFYFDLFRKTAWVPISSVSGRKKGPKVT